MRTGHLGTERVRQESKNASDAKYVWGVEPGGLDGLFCEVGEQGLCTAGKRGSHVPKGIRQMNSWLEAVRPQRAECLLPSWGFLLRRALNKLKGTPE